MKSIRKIFVVTSLIFLVACQSQVDKNQTNQQGSSEQNESSSSAEFTGPEKDFVASSFGWKASIPKNWEGYTQKSLVKNGNDFIVVSNYDPSANKKKPDDYHEIKIERLEAGEEELISTITDGLLEGKSIDARKLLFTKEYQGTRIEFSEIKGGKGLMTIFRQGSKIWVLTYVEPEILDGQTKWVYQRLIETFKITE